MKEHLFLYEFSSLYVALSKNAIFYACPQIFCKLKIRVVRVYHALFTNKKATLPILFIFPRVLGHSEKSRETSPDVPQNLLSRRDFCLRSRPQWALFCFPDYINEIKQNTFCPSAAQKTFTFQLNVQVAL